MQYKDYYQILGVEKQADAKQIKAAFRRLARKCHPDVNPNDASAEEKFKEINEAFEVLGDPEKRAKYDTLGPNWQQAAQAGTGAGSGGFPGGWKADLGGFGGGGGGFSDFFEAFFGGTHPPPQHGGRGTAGAGRRPWAHKGQDYEYFVQVPLREAATGSRRSVSLDAEEVCPVCAGSGEQESRSCPRCGGRGLVARQRTLSVKVPPGVREGSRIRLAGEGGPGSGGGPAGDLYLVVQLKNDPPFRIEDDSVVVDLPVSAPTAVLGGSVEVPTLGGDRVKMRIPAGTQGGQTFRLRGKGLPPLGNHPQGDLLAKVQITVPMAPDERERELWQQLAELAGDRTTGPLSGGPVGGRMG